MSVAIEKLDYDQQWADVLEAMVNVSYPDDNPNRCILEILCKFDRIMEAWGSLVESILVAIDIYKEGLEEIVSTENHITDDELTQWKESLAVHRSNLGVGRKVLASGEALRKRMMQKAARLRRCHRQQVAELCHVN